MIAFLRDIDPNMELPANRVYQILQDKGIRYLYHANSVLTSCQFLRAGALLSRGTIERRELYQTDQSSDDIDYISHNMTSFFFTQWNPIVLCHRLSCLTRMGWWHVNSH